MVGGNAGVVGGRERRREGTWAWWEGERDGGREERGHGGRERRREGMQAWWEGEMEGGNAGVVGGRDREREGRKEVVWSRE
jgi:hypothetical protein